MKRMICMIEKLSTKKTKVALECENLTEMKTLFPETFDTQAFFYVQLPKRFAMSQPFVKTQNIENDYCFLWCTCTYGVSY